MLWLQMLVVWNKDLQSWWIWMGVSGRWLTAHLKWVYCVQRRIQGHSRTRNFWSICCFCHHSCWHWAKVMCTCVLVWKQTYYKLCLFDMDKFDDFLQPSCPNLRRTLDLWCLDKKMFSFYRGQKNLAIAVDVLTIEHKHLNFMQRVYFWIGLQYHTTVAQSYECGFCSYL